MKCRTICLGKDRGRKGWKVLGYVLVPGLVARHRDSGGEGESRAAVYQSPPQQEKTFSTGTGRQRASPPCAEEAVGAGSTSEISKGLGRTIADGERE